MTPANEASTVLTSPALNTASDAPRKSKRTHAWHASYAVLAVLTTQLLLSGCNKEPDGQVGAETEQIVPNEAPAPSAGYPADPAMSAPGATDPAMTAPDTMTPGATAPGTTEPGATDPMTAPGETGSTPAAQ